MSFTILAAPEHVTPQQISMPTLKDPVGNGTVAFRRLQKRPLSSWELVVPGREELLAPVRGLLEHIQGDTPFWFDGAGFGEVVTQALMSIGGAITTTDYDLPHRYVYVSSLVIQINASNFGNWIPLGGDGIVCDSIRFDTGINPNYPITAKYRRRIKCVLRTEEKAEMSRSFRSNVSSENIHRLKYVIEEVAT